MIKINEYSNSLKQRFKNEKERIESLIPDNCIVDHVGSSAVGIGGKNIIDILIGVTDEPEMRSVCEILKKNGYFEGKNKHKDRIFLANRKEETGEGDFHIHICTSHSNSYQDFITLRDFLIANPEKANEYFKKKQEFAREANFDREKYKTLKSQYVSKLLLTARDDSPQ